MKNLFKKLNYYFKFRLLLYIGRLFSKYYKFGIKTTLSGKLPKEPDNRRVPNSDKLPSGQHKDYWVLNDKDRNSKTFVRPYRDTYTHKKCNSSTKMGIKLAETYAADPNFYGSTFCCKCRSHFPVSEFLWEGTNEEVGS